MILVKGKDDTVLYAILALLLLTLAAVFYEYFTRISRKAVLALEINDVKSCVMVPLAMLPYSPKFLHVQANVNISNLHLTGWIRLRLMYQADGFTLTNLVGNSILPISSEASISPIMALKFRLILKSKPFVYIIALHGSHAFHMRVCPPQCTQCNITMNCNENLAEIETQCVTPGLTNLHINYQ